MKVFKYSRIVVKISSNSPCFPIFKNSNGKLTLNVEINKQDIRNTDINLLIKYLEQYKHKNKINFEEIIITFDTLIINQDTFDLIEDKTHEEFELNNN